MVTFTFVCKEDGGSWSAKQVSLASSECPDQQCPAEDADLCVVGSQTSGEDHELTAEAADSSSLQKELYQLAITNSSGGGVSTLYSTISPSSAVYQVNLQPCKVQAVLPCSAPHVHGSALCIWRQSSCAARTAVRHTICSRSMHCSIR